MKKLFKAVVWLVVLLVAAGFLFVWLGLGVNPLEGDAENLWDLVSNEVDFFVRFPGADLLSEPVVEGLGREEGFDGIARAKDALMKAMRDAAEQANPQIPLGLFQIDPENDLRGKEVAFAGTCRDLSRPRLDNFVLLARIPGYAKFVSALTRDFVRSKVPNGDRISVVSGFYFKIKDPGIATMLAPYRSGARHAEPDALWFARIRDVLVLTDEPSWIEAALKGGGDVLPGDVNFKTQFVPASVRRGDVEVLLREGPSGSTMQNLGRLDRNGALYALSRIVPYQMAGNVIAQATPEQDGVALKLLDYPPTDGYSKIGKSYLVKLYERGKADLRFDYTENGIGRLLPRNGVAAAMVLHAEADTLAALFMDSLSEADRSNLDDVAKQASGGGRGYGSYGALLEEIAKDLGDTHLVVIHRPSIFDTVDTMTAEEIVDAANPAPQLSFSLICTVRDSSSPEKVVEKVSQNLRYLGLKPTEDAKERPQQLLHESGKFYVVSPLGRPNNASLFMPAYAAVTEGGKFFVFTSSVECMEAVLLAAKDQEARLIAEPGVAACAAKLPPEGTLSILVRGRELRDMMRDRVRPAFRLEYPDDGLMKNWRAKLMEEGIKDDDELDRRVGEELAQFIASEYPTFREVHWERTAAMGALDTGVLGLSLGVGSTKMVTGGGYLLTRRGAAPERRSD